MVLAASLTACASPIETRVRQDLDKTEAALYKAPPTDKHSPTSESERTPALPDSAGLYDFIAYAVRNNPGVEAAFNRWRAATERIPQAKAFPDPRFTFGHFFESVETRVGPQEHRMGLSQMFPWFGTLRLKGDIAAHDAQIAQQHFEAAQDRLYYRVSSAYAEYYYLTRAIGITQELFEIMQNAESVAQAKYRAGTGAYADVIRAQVELGRLEDRLLELRDKKRPAAARLNALLNRPPDAELPGRTALPTEGLALTDEDILARARTMNPAVRALDFQIEREHQAVNLAKRRYYPNITLGVDYLSTGAAVMPDTPQSGKDPVIGMVSINLPIWWGSYAAGHREAEARQRAAQLDRQNLENQILAQAHEVLFEFHNAERKIDLYRDALVPKAEQSINASMRGYEAGKVDFLDFLDAQRMLLNFELAYDRARANHVTRLAELRMLAGGTYNEPTSNMR
jgi:cobalt-zinc-cadmium efflux system outer membrane protein